MIFCKPKYDGGFKMSEYLPEGKLISEQENINILHSLKMLEDAKTAKKFLRQRLVYATAVTTLLLTLQA